MQKSPKTSRMQESYWVNYYRLVSMTRFAATYGEGGACARSNHLPRSKGSPSSCKDDVGSLRGVLATSGVPHVVTTLYLEGSYRYPNRLPLCPYSHAVRTSRFSCLTSTLDCQTPDATVALELRNSGQGDSLAIGGLW